METHTVPRAQNASDALTTSPDTKSLTSFLTRLGSKLLSTFATLGGAAASIADLNLATDKVEGYDGIDYTFATVVGVFFVFAIAAAMELYKKFITSVKERVVLVHKAIQTEFIPRGTIDMALPANVIITQTGLKYQHTSCGT